MNKKTIVVIIVLSFLYTSFFPISYGKNVSIDENKKIVQESEKNDIVSVNFYYMGIDEQNIKEIELSKKEVEAIFNKIQKYSIKIASDSSSIEAKYLKNEIFEIADEKGLLSENIFNELLTQDNSELFKPKNQKISPIIIPQNRASALLCNFATTGEGSQFPIIIFPRLIPILLVPIPRIFLKWSAIEGVTSCGSLLTGKGFIATGQQNGLSLGFWGIGFSVFLPPIMQYGFIGYAILSTVTADNIELWPPNSAPEVYAVSPPDGAIGVSPTISDLTFEISDFDGDLMDFTVTTDPNIGFGSGQMKKDGIFSVDVSGLEGLTEYQWTVSVSDGEDTVEKTFTFITEAVEPIVSNPNPPNNAKNIPLDLDSISFSITDYQEDPIDWTLETVPYIGSGSASGVGNGEYSVEISGLDFYTEYKWYLNATDGENWAHKVFYFKTRALPGDWWNQNWHYRKEIIVDYSKVIDSLNNYPLLVDLESDEFTLHTQEDGDDFVFTDYYGNKLNHEIEFYNFDDGKLIVWVNVPILNDETIIYLYYGNPDCGNQQNVEGTWSSDYVMVQHLQEDSGQHYDSTSNNHDSIVTIVTDQNTYGIIDGADDLERDNGDHIDIPDSPDWEFSDNPLTISFWVKLESASNTCFFMYENYGYNLYYYSNSDILEWDFNPATTILKINWDPILDKWYYITLTRVGDIHSIYIDGTIKNSVSNSDPFPEASGPFKISGAGAGGVQIDGKIDEFRVLNEGLSQQWIFTEYNNLLEPSNFITIGEEEIN